MQQLIALSEALRSLIQLEEERTGFFFRDDKILEYSKNGCYKMSSYDLKKEYVELAVSRLASVITLKDTGSLTLSDESIVIGWYKKEEGTLALFKEAYSRTPELSGQQIGKHYRLLNPIKLTRDNLELFIEWVKFINDVKVDPTTAPKATAADKVAHYFAKISGVWTIVKYNPGKALWSAIAPDGQTITVELSTLDLYEVDKSLWRMSGHLIASKLRAGGF